MEGGLVPKRLELLIDLLQIRDRRILKEPRSFKYPASPVGVRWPFESQLLGKALLRAPERRTVRNGQHLCVANWQKSRKIHPHRILPRGRRFRALTHARERNLDPR